jgi:hypothetical protein
MSTGNRKISRYCPICNSIVESEIIFSYEYDIRQINEDRRDGTLVTLTKCINCENPMLFSEDFVEVEDHYFPQGEFQLYPERDKDFITNAPDLIIKPYKEALKCFKANAYEACVIMCRKGIEAICYDKGESNGNLMKRLKTLNEKGSLENTFFNWANELREIGNIGAHSHETEISKQDAMDTLEFFEALILYLYHLVDKYTKLIDRKNTKTTTK